MYADDTLLIEQGETQESSVQACQEALDDRGVYRISERGVPGNC